MFFSLEKKMCFVDICELVLFTDYMLSELIKKPFNAATVVYAMIQIFKRLFSPANKQSSYKS